MQNRESEEMYLETILLLRERKPQVRSIDIAEERGYAKSSVSRAVSLLQSRGYIIVEEDGAITLTPAGERRATDIYDRHRVLTELLMQLGAPLDMAEDNACRIEHVITPELFDIIKRGRSEKDAQSGT